MALTGPEFWGLLLTFIGLSGGAFAWVFRLAGQIGQNTRDISMLGIALEKLERRFAEERREDLERVEVSRRETNAKLEKIDNKMDDILKELRQQGRDK